MCIPRLGISTITLLTVLVGAALPMGALAFVSSPVGGVPGRLDLRATVDLERGKVEPNEREESFQPAEWQTYGLSATYNFPVWNGLHGLYVRLGGLWVDTLAERGSDVPADLCLGRRLASGECEFYGPDAGAVVKLAAGADLIHTPTYALAVFLQGSLPIGLSLDKFVTTRVDYLAGGLSVGVRLSPWLTHSTALYLGTGAPKSQNATVALTQTLNPEVHWGVPLVFRFGTYFDGDLSERFDRRYDAAYTPGFPEQRDRIRMMRFGMVMGVTAALTTRYAVEATYVQKIFGYDTPATRFFTLGAQVSL